jgi:transcriptional regulator GlxA family with amidase domain
MKIMNFTVGVVLLDPFQLMDAAGPVDLLYMAGRKYQNASGPIPPQSPNIEIHWIGPSMNVTGQVTSNIKINPTATFDHHPKLDVLFVPGPPPSYRAPAQVAKFLRRAVKEVPIIMADCSGPLVLAQIGLLDGKNATLNKKVVPLAKQMYPKVEWQDDVRWVVDGKYWTGGGAVSGMSMAVAFLQSGNFGNLGFLPLQAADGIEFEPKGQLRE